MHPTTPQGYTGCETSSKYGTYTLNVRYRTADGREEDNTVTRETFGFPFAGDAMTLLRDPNSGRVEDDPFPELWVILTAVYLGFGGLAWFFGWGITQVLVRQTDDAKQSVKHAIPKKRPDDW